MHEDLVFDLMFFHSKNANSSKLPESGEENIMQNLGFEGSGMRFARKVCIFVMSFLHKREIGMKRPLNLRKKNPARRYEQEKQPDAE